MLALAVFSLLFLYLWAWVTPRPRAGAMIAGKLVVFKLILVPITLLQVFVPSHLLIYDCIYFDFSIFFFKDANNPM